MSFRKKNVKKISAMVILLITAAFYAYLYMWYIPEYTTIDKHFKRIPGELYVYRNGKEIPFRDRELVNRFTSLVQKKKGKKITMAEAKTIKNNSIIHFDYGYKEDGMWIAGDGMIVFAVDKAEIRNRSVIGYIWWKIISDSSVNLYYKTTPDPEASTIVHEILKKIEKESLTKAP